MAQASISLPIPPGPWCTDSACRCGGTVEEYDKYNSRVTFAEASARLREENQRLEIEEQPWLTFRSGRKDEAPGGYRGRGGVLHVMRVIKMERFYADHELCEHADDYTPEEWADHYEAYGGYGADEYLEWYDEFRSGETSATFEEWARGEGDLEPVPF